MNAAAIQAKIAAQIAALGETITINPGSAGSFSFLGVVEAVTSAAPGTLGSGSGLLLTIGGVPAQATIVSGATNFQYPAVAVFFDPLQAGVPPASTSVFTRDGLSLTIRVVFSHRLSNTILLYVALASA